MNFAERLEPMQCPVCNGMVYLDQAVEQQRVTKAGTFRFPPQVLVPKCQACGEIFLRRRDSLLVDATLAMELAREHVEHRMAELVAGHCVVDPSTWEKLLDYSESFPGCRMAVRRFKRLRALVRKLGHIRGV